MRLPPIPSEWIDLPDDELGLKLLAWWIAAQAEIKGIDPTAIPEHIAEKIIIATQGMDTDQAHNAALEKALIKAALGDLAKAGSLFRGYMLIGANAMATADILSNIPEDTRRGTKVRRSATLGHEAIYGTPVEKETKRRQRLDLLDEIRRCNPDASNRKIYEIAEASSLECLGEKLSYKAFERAENKEKS